MQHAGNAALLYAAPRPIPTSHGTPAQPLQASTPAAYLWPQVVHIELYLLEGAPAQRLAAQPVHQGAQTRRQHARRNGGTGELQAAAAPPAPAAAVGVTGRDGQYSVVICCKGQRLLVCGKPREGTEQPSSSTLPQASLTHLSRPADSMRETDAST